jgi:hypothetical protein
MGRKEKLGDRGGVNEWVALRTSGDIQRLLAWCVRSLRNGSLERADAMAFSQLGAVLLKAVETSAFETRLENIEKHLVTPENHDTGSQTVTH